MLYQVELESVFIPPYHNSATDRTEITMIGLILIWVTFELALHIGSHPQ